MGKVRTQKKLKEGKIQSEPADISRVGQVRGARAVWDSSSIIQPISGRFRITYGGVVGLAKCIGCNVLCLGPLEDPQHARI